MSKVIELYIHIPFCIRKCKYCDFLSYPAQDEARSRYVDALCQEIRSAGNHIRSGGASLSYDRSETGGSHGTSTYTVRSVYLGGGTPSILSGSQIRTILDQVRNHFVLLEDVEITMEANPGTLSPKKLKAFHDAGVNRLSIGLQTSEDRCLRMLGRIHSWSDFLDNYDQARTAGFDNINVDIMSALPGQTLKSYHNTLKEVTKLNPEHISSYSLILEEGTPLSHDDVLLSLIPDEETDRLMYKMTKNVLEEAGYHRYEISNYAKAGKECIHNLGYWEDVPYLGFGLGASSYWKEEKAGTDEKYLRFSNESNPDNYLANPFPPYAMRADYQELSREDRMSEYMFLGLRKIRGVEIRDFKTRFGCDMDFVYGDTIKKYLDMGLMYIKDGKLALTDQGIDVSNQIFCDFI